MKIFVRFFPLLLVFCILGCSSVDTPAHILHSPAKFTTIEFALDEHGVPVYTVFFKGDTIIRPSQMQFEFKDQPAMRGNMKVVDGSIERVEDNWEMPWGEKRYVENIYNEMVLDLMERQSPRRSFSIHFRAYDDGVAFRYQFNDQRLVDSVIILEERTDFNLKGDHTVWWIPGDWDIYEHLYSTTLFSEIDATTKRDHPNLAATFIPYNAVNTPVTMKTENGLYLSFHEANLTDYAGMTLAVDTSGMAMHSLLVGSDRLGYKVKRALPFYTPWRTIQISKTAAGLIESDLIVNLNEPSKVDDISWFVPKKYMGIWWEMHLDISSWDLASGRHGATTDNAMNFIDFASANNITGLLVEGWNTGWERWIGFDDREGVFDFITPYPDYDLSRVVAYGKDKGVELIMHHETSAAPRTYDQQIDTAFALMQSLGIHSVKTGYVGKIIPKGEYHHGQWMVNHYRRVLDKGLQYNIAINAHEPIKATGLRRTYPNAISREGLRGQEFNAWASDGGNPPEHLPIVVFTRMLAGPIDFTPGVFDISLKQKPDNKVNTTIAHQLALYVVINSPIQMACDLVENYEGHPAFQFIRDVGVTWDDTRVLGGEVGDYVIIARQERETGAWFVGGITDEEERSVRVHFDFLPVSRSYNAVIYRDGDEAHYRDNPTDYTIENTVVDSQSERDFVMRPGGGFAISLNPVSK